jgi:two-component system, sensor histidine kinase YesM
MRTAINRVLNRFNDISTRNKLLLSYVLLVFIPVIIVGIILTSGMKDMALNQSIAEAKTNVERLEKNISDILTIPTDFSNTLFADNILESIISTRYSRTIDVVEAYWQYTKFDDYLRLYNYIDSIMLYTENETIIENWRFMKITADIKASPWYKDAIVRKGMISWDYIYNPYKKRYTLSMTRLVGTSGNPLGVLLIDINKDFLNSLLGKEPFDTVIIDENGIIASAKDLQIIGKPIRELGLDSYMIDQDQGTYQTDFRNRLSEVIIKSFYPTGSLSKMRIVCSFPINSITDVANRTGLVGFGIIASSLFVALIFIFLFSKVLSKRLNSLSKQVHKVALGNFSISTPIIGGDEIGLLSQDINLMASSIERLMSEIQEAETQKHNLVIKQKEIKLKMLANQINPHFLFNILETIRMRISNIGEVETADVVALLGKIMRRNLEVGSEMTTIDEETVIVRSYLDIQKFRYRDKLQYEIDISDELVSYKILPLIVQPIVENAVIHGLENKRGVGTVALRAFVDGSFTIISVIDDGIGMDACKLKRITASLNDPENDNERKIGLKNVHQRIKLQYGEAYGLTIKSEPGNGTRVDLILPKIVS